MQTTFFIEGPSKTPGILTTGTAFFLIRPFSAQPDPQRVAGKLVLVTAAHVFEGIEGDSAIIIVRTQTPGSQEWIAREARLVIRRNQKALWLRHPDADVAVMYLKWPLPVDVAVSTAMLANDELIQGDDVGPGLELKVLGYPLNTPANDAWFPILRSGAIASYPLLPTAATKTFLLDFRVFKGNSGRPVYFSQPTVKGGSYVCCPPQFVMGLVSGEELLTMPYSELQLSVGKIVFASFIEAAIELLPAPESRDSDAATVPVELVSTRTTHP